jgi:predicted Zn-dependent protease with MMP-like domain
MTPQMVLAKFCMRLRALDERAWDDFVQCFDAYTTEVTVAVTEAPQDKILNAQGRAQAMLIMLNTFRNCAELSQQRPPKE